LLARQSCNKTYLEVVELIGAISPGKTVYNSRHWRRTEHVTCVYQCHRHILYHTHTSIGFSSYKQLRKSGTKFLLPLKLHHHLTVSNTTLKPIISPFHEIPTHQVFAHTSELSVFLTLVYELITLLHLNHMMLVPCVGSGAMGAL